MRPRVLDLFCCLGGASEGYRRAGFDVYGVDLFDAHRRSRYPFPAIQGDALVVLEILMRPGRWLQFDHGVMLGLHDFDVIAASPPCQFYTRGNAPRRAAGTSKWPRSIPPIREALEATGKPYIIENVADAAWDMHDPVTLCGCMFDLSTLDTDGIRIHLRRPRLFEVSGFTLTPPRPCDHTGQEWVAGAYGGARRNKYDARYIRRGGYVPPDKDVVKALLGVEHDMTWGGLYECLPPAYTEHIGTQLLLSLALDLGNVT